MERLHGAALAAGETLRLYIRRRRRLQQVRNVEATTHQLDHVVGNVSVLARHATTLTRLRTCSPDELGRAVRALAGAVRSAGDSLATEGRRAGRTWPGYRPTMSKRCSSH